MNRLGRAKQAQIIAALVEGNSLRATAHDWRVKGDDSSTAGIARGSLRRVSG